jgi:hypothetical protein
MKMQFKIEGLPVIPGTDARVTLHQMSDGSVLPMTLPPLRNGEIPDESHAAAFPVKRAAEALAALDIARRNAATDKNLSDHGRAEKVKGAREAAQRAVSEAEAALGQLEANTAGLLDQALAAPKLETVDVEGALVDQEIRSYARGLNDKQRTDYMQTLKGNARHLDALLRSPVPIALITDHAKRLRAESLDNSPAVLKAKGYADAIDWARGLLPSIKNKI